MCRTPTRALTCVFECIGAVNERNWNVRRLVSIECELRSLRKTDIMQGGYNFCSYSPYDDENQ